MQRGHPARTPGAGHWLRRAQLRLQLHLLLPLALLAAQTLGLWHGVVHPHAAGGALQAAVAHAQAAHGQPAHAGASLAQHDDGSALCRLVDHLAHADMLVAAPLGVLPAAVHGLATAPTPPGVAASTCTPYEARGPPGPAWV